MLTARLLFSASLALLFATGCNDTALGGGDVDPGMSMDPPVTDVFQVLPTEQQSLQVTVGQQPATVAYTATLNGEPCAALWSVDRSDVGYVSPGPASDTAFVPRGSASGLATIKVTCSGQTRTREVRVSITGTQNGVNTSVPGQVNQVPKTVGDLTSGGGVGGVGGEGLGVPVTDQATLDALKTPTMNGAAQGLTFLYPYDATVWPRGILAPLLQWRWSLCRCGCSENRDRQHQRIVLVERHLRTPGDSYHHQGAVYPSSDSARCVGYGDKQRRGADGRWAARATHGQAHDSQRRSWLRSGHRDLGRRQCAADRNHLLPVVWHAAGAKLRRSSRRQQDVWWRDSVDSGRRHRSKAARGRERN
jgi:hypothetical protein